MKPYYEHAGITIYHGDCREILPELKADVILSDPPYGVGLEYGCHDDSPEGYWEWFRLDGTRMRSGYFDHGTQVGEWITYDRRGEVHKVTMMRAPKTPSE